MTKYDRESETLVDLGAVTEQTKGQGRIVQADLATEQYKPGSMLSAD